MIKSFVNLKYLILPSGGGGGGGGGGWRVMYRAGAGKIIFISIKWKNIKKCNHTYEVDVTLTKWLLLSW